MGQRTTNSPLLGYNTNVRHAGHLFHIQTEDSGVGHPHVITHLFTEGTILSSKKTSYDEYLEQENWEETVRQLMKDQHKAMFVELRDGVHDEIAETILGKSLQHESAAGIAAEGASNGEKKDGGVKVQGSSDAGDNDVKVITPETIDRDSVTASSSSVPSAPSRGVSIFETPDTSGSFGESLISDKSLDEVILTYLADELDE